MIVFAVTGATHGRHAAAETRFELSVNPGGIWCNAMGK